MTVESSVSGLTFLLFHFIDDEVKQSEFLSAFKENLKSSLLS